MLDETAITDQKIAVGLVENPCCWALEALAAHVPADQAIVEIGAFKGRSTGWLALGAQKGNGARVVSIDPHDDGELPRGYPATPTTPTYTEPTTREAYLAHLERTGVAPFVDYMQATAVDAAKAYTGPKVGLIWHDGIHTATQVAADLRAWIKHAADDAVIVLHDTDDARYGVAQGAERALTGSKAARDAWAWESRIIHPWPKNDGKAPESRRRGFTVVHTRGSTYPQLDKPVTARLV